jgi:uncharacterized protein involved in outer membrane biogenesis
MRRLFRWVVRIVLGLILLAVAMVVVVILLRDTITKGIIVRRLRSQTGMESSISAVHVGWLAPTISIEGLKLYNTADFGGAVCLDVPELRLEYDAAALRSRQLHLTLLRLDVADLSCVVDKNGRNNFEMLKKKGKESGRHKSASEKWKFTGIDVLNVTLGKFHLANLASGRGQEINFGIKNQILRHVKTGADLSPLGLAALSHSRDPSTGGDDVDLDQVLESLFKAP